MPAPREWFDSDAAYQAYLQAHGLAPAPVVRAVRVPVRRVVVRRFFRKKRVSGRFRPGLFKKRQKPRSRKRPVSFKSWLRDYLSKNRAVRMTSFR